MPQVDNSVNFLSCNSSRTLSGKHQLSRAILHKRNDLTLVGVATATLSPLPELLHRTEILTLLSLDMLHTYQFAYVGGSIHALTATYTCV